MSYLLQDCQMIENRNLWIYDALMVQMTEISERDDLKTILQQLKDLNCGDEDFEQKKLELKQSFVDQL